MSRTVGSNIEKDYKMSVINLPAVVTQTSPVIKALTEALKVPREILATDEEIEGAWRNLPRVLKKVPPQLRTEGLAKMCVAVAVGLFDSAINYVWNSAIIELREKIKRFGLPVVQQVIGDSNFDNKALIDLKDAELIELCLKLNLINEDGYFFLDQCRDIRNNFSAAHPTIGKIDDSEFISFLNRCAKYALGDENNPVGVDIQAFMSAIRGGKFTDAQKDEWCRRLAETHDAQRGLLFGTLQGIFCDSSSSEEARVNSLKILRTFKNNFTPQMKSSLIDRHQEYGAKGDDTRHKASQILFEKLGLLSLLSDSERHSVISNACKKLFSVHQAFDNFYNEPPFAERLISLSKQGAIPDTAKSEFVTVVATCAVGNPYGVSHAAIPFYHEMIRNFTPAEIEILLNLPASRTVVGNRLGLYERCKRRFKEIIGLIDSNSVPTSTKGLYKKYTI